MASERVTLTVRSNIGDEGPLSVEDAMRQILDFFELLSDAQEDEEHGKAVAWQLVSISMNSPLEASAEPYAVDPMVPVEMIARRAKARVAQAFAEVTEKGEFPKWVKAPSRERVRRILKRNTNGIGRTDIKVNDYEPVVAIVEKNARAALLLLDRNELASEAAKEDFTRTELGSIEGEVVQAITHYNKPAIVIRERLSGQDVVCVLSQELAQKIGPEHRWDEVWQSRRVLVSGDVFYRMDGLVSRVAATEFVSIDQPRIATADFLDSAFTGRLTPTEYLDRLREGDIG